MVESIHFLQLLNHSMSQSLTFLSNGLSYAFSFCPLPFVSSFPFSQVPVKGGGLELSSGIMSDSACVHVPLASSPGLLYRRPGDEANVHLLLLFSLCPFPIFSSVLPFARTSSFHTYQSYFAYPMKSVMRYHLKKLLLYVFSANHEEKQLIILNYFL